MTPLEILQAEKERIQQECFIKETDLNNHFCYIQQNAGTLLLSGISSLLFPRNKTNQKKSNANKTQLSLQTTGQPTATNSTLSIKDLMGLGKALLPAAWEVVQPILISWGMRKMTTWVSNLFTKKKK